MRRSIIAGLIAAVLGSLFAWADGINIPFSFPATTCTAQFIRSIAASTGVGSCATVANADLANSTITLYGVSKALGTSYAPAKANVSGVSVTATTSTSLVMMGLAGTITPATTGTLIMNAYATFQNNTLNDGCVYSLRVGTGTAPVNGAVSSGTQVNPVDSALTAGVGAQAVPGSLSGYVTGLTVSTAYWMDMAFAATTGGTCTPSRAAISAVEQ